MKEGRLEPCLPMGAVLSRSGVSGSLRPRGLQPRQAPLSLDSPAEDTGVGCRALLQGTLPIQRLKQPLVCFLH